MANEVKQSQEIAASSAPRNDYFLKAFTIVALNFSHSD